jgi:hypothetical protein
LRSTLGPGKRWALEYVQQGSKAEIPGVMASRRSAGGSCIVTTWMMLCSQEPLGIFAG